MLKTWQINRWGLDPEKGGENLRSSISFCGFASLMPFVQRCQTFLVAADEPSQHISAPFAAKLKRCCKHPQLIHLKTNYGTYGTYGTYEHLD